MNREQNGSILVVDDDPHVRESSCLLLKEYGYYVTASADAKDAINRIQKNRIDVVVTDIVMPFISGIELLREVHNVDPGIPVILMTAYADMEKVIEAIKLGAFDFIVKPFNPELLVHSVKKAVNYNRLIQMEKDYKRLLEEYTQGIETLVAERTMSLMALTLADKIRNPAAVIGLASKRIIDREDVPESLKSKLRDIADEAQKLEVIVRDFQSLLKSKKSMFKYEDVNEILKNITLIFSSKAAWKGVKFTFNSSESPLRINLQKNLFQIAVSHIIKNAIEATSDGGIITVSVNEEGNNIILTISDTGCGIREEDIDKIFDPMFSTKEKRFGMGLPLVKKIISEHMGEIGVESRKGEGTTFRIRLPLRWTPDQL